MIQKYAEKYGKIPITFFLIFIALILFSIYARVEGFWYSSYQGDEINTVDFVKYEGSALDYLFSKKRGPTQYLLNIASYNVFGNLSEYFIRLPYLIFGILSIFAIYAMVSQIFNKRTGFFAALFLATNGLYLAFARITQYQALMYFLIPMQIIYFIYALKKDKNMHLLLSGILGSIIVLTHYDAASVVPFYLAIIFGFIVKDRNINIFQNIVKNVKTLITKLCLFFTGYLVPSLAWYIPYSMNDSFSNKTSGYLSGRLFGGGLNPRLHEKYELLTMYMPKEYMWIMMILCLVGIVYIIYDAFDINFQIDTATLNNKVKNKDFKFLIKYLNPKNTITIHYYLPVGLISVFIAFLIYINFKPQSDAGGLILLITSILIAAYLFFSNKFDIYKSAVIIWFLGSYSFYFLIMKDPRTHVYISFIPLFILAAYGIYKTIYHFPKTQIYVLTFLTSIMLFVSLVNYRIFVDRSPEYPWLNQNKVLGYDIYEIDRVSHGRVEGVFGFNNYRQMDKIGEMFKNGCLAGTYQSNEKNSITSFYIGKDQVYHTDKELLTEYDKISKDVLLIDNNIDNVIWVEGPHSWSYQNIQTVTDKMPEDYTTIYEYTSEGQLLMRIWGRKLVYPDGKILCEIQ